ncbi:MAG: hypothetical protein RIA63_08765, partial [Cyclobacteriaceae bacterium]
MRVITFFVLLLGVHCFGQDNSFILGKPTGNFAVGVAGIRIERAGTSFESKIWYPAENVIGLRPESYIQSYDITLLAETFSNIPFGFDRSFFESINVLSNSFLNAPISSSEDKYPVLIFSHGFGWSFPEYYTSLMEHLASYGYVIFSIHHPQESAQATLANGHKVSFDGTKLNLFMSEIGSAFGSLMKSTSDEERLTLSKEVIEKGEYANTVVETWVTDFNAMFEELPGLDAKHPLFASKLDLSRIGALGHSLGGACAVHFAITNDEIDVVINLDGFPYGRLPLKKLTSPFLLMSSENFSTFNEAAYANYVLDSFAHVFVKGIQHNGYTDMALWPLKTGATQAVGSE